MDTNTLRKIGGELFLLAFPMAITQFITVGSGFVCMAMIAGLGHDVLAASALIFSTRLSILIIGSSILFAISVLVGHAFGEGKLNRIGSFMQLGWLLGALLSIPVMIIFWKISSILLYFGQSPQLVAIVKTFFRTNIWNVFPFLVSIPSQQFLYGIRKQKIDLFANLIGVVLLVSTAYLFVFGVFGFPQMGVAGLGIALDLQGWSYLIFTSAVIFGSDFFKKFNLFHWQFSEYKNDFMQMIKVGWPILFQVGGEMLFFFTSTSMVGWLGTNSLAAFQVVMQYLILVIVPLFALAQASGVLIGQANGEKNKIKIRKIGTASFIFSTVITLSVALLFILFPKALAALYLNVNDPVNQETVHLIIILFSIIAISQIFDNTRNVATGALRGLFDTKYPMVVGFLVLWLIAIPCGYLLAFPMHFGVAGVSLGTAIGMLIGAILVIHRWLQLMKN